MTARQLVVGRRASSRVRTTGQSDIQRVAITSDAAALNESIGLNAAAQISLSSEENRIEVGIARET